MTSTSPARHDAVCHRPDDRPGTAMRCASESDSLYQVITGNGATTGQENLENEIFNKKGPCRADIMKSDSNFVFALKCLRITPFRRADAS